MPKCRILTDAKVGEIKQVMMDTLYPLIFYPNTGFGDWDGVKENIVGEFDTISNPKAVYRLDSVLLTRRQVNRHDECFTKRTVMLASLPAIKPENMTTLISLTNVGELCEENQMYRIVMMSGGAVFIYDKTAKLLLHHLLAEEVFLKDVIFSTRDMQMLAKEVYWRPAPPGLHTNWFLPLEGDEK